MSISHPQFAADDLQQSTTGIIEHEQEDIAIILQSLCHLHKWTRTNSDAGIYERSDRLRSIRIGIATVHARLSAEFPDKVPSQSSKGKKKEEDDTEDSASLEELLGELSLNKTSMTALHSGYPFGITTTSRRIALSSLASPSAVSTVHGEAYIPRLLSYISNVSASHASQTSEVPEHLSQGDLYLCDTSLAALEGALGACCEAVDQVCANGKRGSKRFVSIRPPGHHCESENPMGFCWLNNIAVTAAHAYLEHHVDRVVILDIDLHHGNGTQEIVWRINALAHQQLLAMKKASPRKGSPKKGVPVSTTTTPPLQIFYGSLHDIDSYPCEDLDPTLIANASVNISGGGGSQYIANVHLQPYASDEAFHSELYPSYRDALFRPAADFLRKTGAAESRTLVLVSAGFDACEHEYAAMSRHGAKVPASFFARFASDARQFAENHSLGRLIAVLEGGYSQRALLTGVGNLMSGLVEPTLPAHGAGWWDAKALQLCENLLAGQATAPSHSKTKSNKPVDGNAQDGLSSGWVVRAKELLVRMEEASPEAVIPKTHTTRLHRTIKTVDPQTSLTARTTRSKGSDMSQPAPADVFSATKTRIGTAALEHSTMEAPAEAKYDPPASAPITPISSPQTVKLAPRTAPLIRFTFKAGEAERNRGEEEIGGQKMYQNDGGHH